MKDIELNVWYRCIVYSKTQKYIKFTNIDKFNNYTGSWIQNGQFLEVDGGWKSSDILNYINLKDLKPLEYEFIHELFDSQDSSNITIALTIINKI